MKISEGLKIIINEYGRDVISTSQCCNILADLGAFKNYPGYRNIFRGLIDCGYMSKMLTLSKWEQVINQWSFDLSTKRGYNHEWTKEIFSQIAQSLELIINNDDIHFDVDSQLKYDFTPKTSSSQFEKYFSSLLNLKDVVNEGNELGISINNFQLRVRQYAFQFDANIPYGYIDVSMELFRIHKLRRIRKLWMALYSKDDRIIKKFYIGEMRNDDSQLKPCINSTGVELDKVCRIILFWG